MRITSYKQSHNIMRIKSNTFTKIISIKTRDKAEDGDGDADELKDQISC